MISDEGKVRLRLVRPRGGHCDLTDRAKGKKAATVNAAALDLAPSHPADQSKEKWTPAVYVIAS